MQTIWEHVLFRAMNIEYLFGAKIEIMCTAYIERNLIERNL